MRVLTTLLLITLLVAVALCNSGCGATEQLERLEALESQLATMQETYEKQRALDAEFLATYYQQQECYDNMWAALMRYWQRKQEEELQEQLD